MKPFETPKALHSSTLAAQALGAGDAETKAIIPPIHLSTTFVRDADNGYRNGYCYGRSDNASVRQAEAVIAGLEHAKEAMLFASGMAAATAVILAFDKPTHIVAPKVMYWGFRNWLRNVPRYGHSIDFVEMTDLDAVARTIQKDKTGLVWLETPGNPLWNITDIAAVADIAHRAGATVCADSTIATPLFTQPLALGADIVMHSATKYLNGHSDVIAGALATSREDGLWERIARVRGEHGGIVGPFEAWLLLRGMRTFHVRVRQQSNTAAALAERLSAHPAIGKVLYPGLPDHDGHAVAARQMKGGFGAMLSICIKRGEAAAIDVAARVNLWKRATSLGGVESLIEHRASMEGEGSPCPKNLLRLSVGLEDIDDLYADLDRALHAR